MYRSTDPVWPDEAYPYRFDFEKVGEARNVPLASPLLPESVADALRPVGTSTGRIVPLSDQQRTTLLQLVGATTATPAPPPASEETRSPAGPRTWWVFHGASYEQASAGGYVWAPQTTKTGGAPFGYWVNVSKLRPGDVIVHYANGYVRALGEVSGEPFDAELPPGAKTDEWGTQGWRAPVRYFELERPISLDEVPGRAAEAGPFTSSGGPKQGYLFELNDAFAATLRSTFVDRWPIDSPWGSTMPPPPPRGQTPLTVELVRKRTDEAGLIIDDSIVAAAVAALLAGKDVVFTGPPGTAKTTLAEAIALAAAEAGQCDGHLLTTATSDWTTFETIGGLRPRKDGELEFSDGQFLEAIRNNHWLIVDEMNRSNFDRAFGQLFTVLSGQSVTLPYTGQSGKPIRLAWAGSAASKSEDHEIVEIPLEWRLIGTMNVFDKSLLFEMSFALMRRFAFIEVPAPSEATYRALIDDRSEGDEDAAAAAGSLLTVRRVKEIGPALFMDMARFAQARRSLGPISTSELTYQLFYSYLLPQFEGIDDQEAETLAGLLKPLLDKPELARLRRDLRDVLGIDLRVIKAVATSDDEAGDTEAVDELDDLT